jgi:cation transport ATPase
MVILGTVLLFFPIVFMLVSGIVKSIQTGEFLMDFLLPLELFFCPLIGIALLAMPVWKEKLERKLLIIGTAVMVFFFLALMIGATLSGLASGETEMNTLAWVLTGIAMGFFILGQIGAGIAGLLLIRKQFCPKPKPTE